ncbi:MAG: hypothetical protein ACFFA3_08595 [Promethearchaeota archaeon]
MGIIISQAVKFDQIALKSIEQDYKRDLFSGTYSKLIRGLSKIICEFIDIPELAMKGIALKALREWESLYNNSIEKIAVMPISKRLNAIKEIFSIGKGFIKDIVSNPKDKDENLIDISFERAFRFFLSYYSQQKH